MSLKEEACLLVAALTLIALLPAAIEAQGPPPPPWPPVPNYNHTKWRCGRPDRWCEEIPGPPTCDISSDCVGDFCPRQCPFGDDETCQFGSDNPKYMACGLSEACKKNSSVAATPF